MTAILQSVALGTQWPTLDPFLFCAHHLDAYPAANGSLGPEASLAGRAIGQDFAGIDGWNMYHGQRVPGFPQHPHRGFETVTYVRRGWCDHSDSLGARARFGEGDAQWVTAGRGIVHSEMFPLFDSSGDNPLHLFQIWLNLPAAEKMTDPRFTMYWSSEIPTVEPGEGVAATVIAGQLWGATPSPPPQGSWAADPSHQVEIAHLQFAAGSQAQFSATAPGVNRVLYVFAGGGVEVDGVAYGADTGLVLDTSVDVVVTAPTGAECMLLGGHPIGEPVAQHGPFVMNDRREIEQAMRDYRLTGFGGWPWPADDPTHGPTPGRFAVLPDGTEVRPKPE